MKTTTLYSLNLVQLDLSEHPPFWLIPLKAGRYRWQSITGYWSSTSWVYFRQFAVLHLVATGNFVGLSSIQLA